MQHLRFSFEYPINFKNNIIYSALCTWPVIHQKYCLTEKDNLVLVFYVLVIFASKKVSPLEVSFLV